MRTDLDPQFQKDVTNHNNDVRVNNSIQLTINLGDTLNIAGLVFGIYLLSKFFSAKRKAAGSIEGKAGKRNTQLEELLLEEPMPTSKYSIH
jgi:hypothetical protein